MRIRLRYSLLSCVLSIFSFGLGGIEVGAGFFSPITGMGLHPRIFFLVIAHVPCISAPPVIITEHGSPSFFPLHGSVISGGRPSALFLSPSPACPAGVSVDDGADVATADDSVPVFSVFSPLSERHAPKYSPAAMSKRATAADDSLKPEKYLSNIYEPPVVVVMKFYLFSRIYYSSFSLVRQETPLATLIVYRVLYRISSLILRGGHPGAAAAVSEAVTGPFVLSLSKDGFFTII